MTKPRLTEAHPEIFGRLLIKRGQTLGVPHQSTLRVAAWDPALTQRVGPWGALQHFDSEYARDAAMRAACLKAARGV